MESRSRRLSVYLAVGVIVAVTLWMLSGLGNEPPVQTRTTSAASAEEVLPMVRTERRQAVDITREILLSGRTEANRSIDIKAEAEGSVIDIAIERGARAASGQSILQLDLRDRESRLAQAQALVRQREAEFQAISGLRGQQFSTEIQIAEAEAALASAEASEATIELELARTTVKAPFPGIVQERLVEIGDFVREGDVVATLVDLDPLIVVGEINERDIAHVQPGGRGEARILDGEKLEGSIRYISSVADPATRTFQLELAVPNADYHWRAGLTAELRLFSGTVRVHTLSSALLSLADDGSVGVKVVEDGKVRFYPVTIAGSAQDGMHVTGLPDSIEVITVGQGYVTEGQQVGTSTQ